MNATLITIPKGGYKRTRVFWLLKPFDRVVLQGRLLNDLHFSLLRRVARKLIFDLDDALFLKDSVAGAVPSRTRRSRFTRTVKGADLVICGNPWLMERVKPLNPRAALLPTVVDTDRYGPHGDRGKHGPFTAIWIGSRSTLFYLEKILPFLEPLAERIEGFRLRVVSDRFPKSKATPVEAVPWSRGRSPGLLADCHAGLMPLSDDDWSRGKCGLKLLQYGAASLPSVCSPVGVNREIVRHGERGFHAGTPEDWRRYLIRLAMDPGLRDRMGRAARAFVEERYALKSHVESFARLIEEA